MSNAREAEVWLKKSNALNAINKALESNYTCLEEVEQKLSESTGFQNYEMAALAFNLEEEYKDLRDYDFAKDVSYKFAKDENGDFIPMHNHFAYQYSEKYLKEFYAETATYIQGEALQIYLKTLEFQEWYNNLPRKYRQGFALNFPGAADMRINKVAYTS